MGQDYLSRIQSGTLSEVEYTRSLLNLGRMLEKHHQSKVAILIDEYDTPIQQGHSRGFYNEDIHFCHNNEPLSIARMNSHLLCVGGNFDVNEYFFKGNDGDFSVMTEIRIGMENQNREFTPYWWGKLGLNNYNIQIKGKISRYLDKWM